MRARKGIGEYKSIYNPNYVYRRRMLRKPKCLSTNYPNLYIKNVTYITTNLHYAPEYDQTATHTNTQHYRHYGYV